ncbi:hypothetical protein IQ273_30265 [Nodosilinea sp. LEGE 07298]|uniref:DUF6671 family protein n=1 Tax=Nodosilinea sp. LEGE 07298 TaxID=2777970 RepID=UPI00187EEE5D|nr:DUF6671 family protein [Nodosilinea sp. LEGE 07298]MBE9113662.1 hypothetical protein [Nodosilinea sp. LEGE 07298]
MANPRDWFAGRVAVLATMHRKEQAIAPLLEAHLGVTVTVPPAFDTDGFGTFTGEVKRPANQLTTARLKAAAALRQTGATLAIASEGSFGPHPQIPFVACDREIVLLCDRQHQLELVGECLSPNTNYRQQVVRSWAEAKAFASTVGFPSHGLIVRADDTEIAKGITTAEELETAVVTAMQQSPSRQARLETDMRAIYNPTRMEVIAQATQALLNVTSQACPACGCPGFSEVKRWPGLPCGHCGTPTPMTLSVRYQCQQCQHQQDAPCPNSPTVADPTYCLYCNP